MTVPDDLLAIIVCPRCRGGLEAPPREDGLVCPRCALRYPVREGIPVLIAEEALSWPKG